MEYLVLDQMRWKRHVFYNLATILACCSLNWTICLSKYRYAVAIFLNLQGSYWNEHEHVEHRLNIENIVQVLDMPHVMLLNNDHVSDMRHVLVFYQHVI